MPSYDEFGECIPEPCYPPGYPQQPCIPCPTIAPCDEITIENTCPDRVSLPGSAKPKTVQDWLAAISKLFCTLNPLGVRSAAPCQLLTTVADPNGGSMVQPKSVLDALNCAPFTAAGQGFLFDGSKVTIAPIAQSIDKLIQLTDGPLSIVPGAFLRGKSGDKWDWASGCLPPCPTSPGLTLQSTSNGGMQWGPLQPIGIQCKDLRSKLNTCIPAKSGMPDKFLGFGDDNCVPTPFKYGWCEALSLGLQNCITDSTGEASSVLGFDANGKPFKYKKSAAATVDCAALKTAAPAQPIAKRPTELLGVGSDGVCGRFVRECDVNFRATSASSDVSTGTALISAWAGAPLYSKMTQDYNTGDCAGVWAVGAGGFQQYTIKEAGRYAIEGSTWVNVRFAGSGSGGIHPDCVWAVISALVITNGGPAKEYRLGESSDSIDYVYDPGSAYSVNNCTKGLTTVGMDFFFSRTLILDLVAGATISVPRQKVNPVYNSGDISAIITTKTDGESSIAITKLAKNSF